MPKPAAALDTFHAPDRATWRAWLAEHHVTVPGVWLILHKKNSPEPSVSYAEAVEEALCFGWIDGRTQKLDVTRYRQMFTPRKPGSTWARSNKERVARLIEQGLMTPAGLAKIEAAQQDGSWSLLDTVEALEVPEDLRLALAANPTAARSWQALSTSAKKMTLFWILSAKRPATRATRIAAAVGRLEQGFSPV